MKSATPLENRLERIEERVGRLEQLQEDLAAREERRRRQERWTRLAFVLVTAVAYALYLRYVTSIA